MTLILNSKDIDFDFKYLYTTIWPGFTSIVNVLCFTMIEINKKRYMCLLLKKKVHGECGCSVCVCLCTLKSVSCRNCNYCERGARINLNLKVYAESKWLF